MIDPFSLTNFEIKLFLKMIKFKLIIKKYLRRTLQ